MRLTGGGSDRRLRAFFSLTLLPMTGIVAGNSWAILAAM